MANSKNIDWDAALDEEGVAPASQAKTPANIDWDKELDALGDMPSSQNIPQPATKSIKESKYDQGYLRSFGDIHEFRAQRQTWGDELANKTAQVLPGILMGTAEILGYMVDLENVGGAVGIETDFDNWLSKGMREAREDWGDKFPVYSRNPNKVMDFGDSAWWINNTGDTVESIMEFLAAGAITGGALGTIGGAAGSAAANSFFTAQGIGALNAHQVYKDLQTGLQGKVNPQTGQIFTPEELQTLASNNAANTYRATALASTLLNMTTLTPFSKGMSKGMSPDKAMRNTTPWLKQMKKIKGDPNAVERGNQALKWYQKQLKPGSTAWEMGQEGIEEIHENWQQQLGVHRGLQTAGQETKFDPWSEENVLAFALGAFGGGIAKAGGSLFSRITKNTEKDKFEGLLDRKIANLEDFQRFNTEVQGLRNSLYNPQLSVEQREKISRDLDQKVLEWRAAGAVEASAVGNKDIINRELQDQLATSKQEGELLSEDESRVKKSMQSLEAQDKLSKAIPESVAPEVKKLIGWTSYMMDGTKQEAAENAETATTIYGASQAGPDIQINSQIAAAEQIIKSTSDPYIKEKATEQLATLKERKAEMEETSSAVNEAAVMAEARQLNNTLLNSKYQEMNTALMDPTQREKVLNEYNKERKVSAEMAEDIAKKEELFAQVDEYLAQDLENMTVSELTAMEEALEASKDIKSPFVEDTLKDTKKLKDRNQGIAMSLDALKAKDRKTNQVEDKAQATPEEVKKDQVSKAKESRLAANEQEQQEDPPDNYQEGYQDPKSPTYTVDDQLTINFRQPEVLPEGEDLPVGIPESDTTYESKEFRKTEQGLEVSSLETVLKSTVQMFSGFALDGERIFSSLVNSDGNVVEQRYIIGQFGGGTQAVFDTIYTEDESETAYPDTKYTMPVYEQDGVETIDGIEYKRPKLDQNGNPIKSQKTFYMKRSAEITTLPVTEVFKTDETTETLRVLNPSIADGTKLFIVREPEWKHFKNTDPGLVALNVYEESDIDETTKRPLEGALPLTQIPSLNRKTKKVSEQVSQLRSWFNENQDETFETVISKKTPGELRILKQGGNLQKNNARNLAKGYVKVGNEYVFKEDHDMPMIVEGRGSKAVVPDSVWERLTEAQKETLGGKELTGQQFETGATFAILINPEGGKTKVYLTRKQLNDKEAANLFKTQGQHNVFSLASQGAKGSKGSNYLPGLTPTYQINNKINVQDAFDQKYNNSMINYIPNVGVVVPVTETDGQQVYYVVPTKPMKSGVNQYNRMANNQTFSIQKFDGQGNKLRNPDPNATNDQYWPLDAVASKLLRTTVGKQFMGTYRNVASKELVDGKTEYTDPFTDQKYPSYLDYLLDTEVITSSVSTEQAFTNTGIWLSSQENTWSDENTTSNPVQEQELKPKVEKSTEVKAVEKTSDPAKPKPAKQSKSKKVNKWRKQAKEDEQKKARLATKKGFAKMGKAELQWFKDIIGDNYLAVAEGVDRVLLNGKEAFGYYHNSMITIAEHAATGTAYHEAFHLVFDLSLDSKKKTALYAAAKKKYKGGNSMTDAQLEEAMADDFMNYRFNRENFRANSVITRFFKGIRDYINNLLGKRTSLDSLFADVSSGNFELNNSLAQDISPRPRLIYPNIVSQETAINSVKKRLLDHLHNTAKLRKISVGNLATIPKEVTSALAEIRAEYEQDLTQVTEDLEALGELETLTEEDDLRGEFLAKRENFFQNILDKWNDTEVEGFNPKDGLGSLVQRSLSSNGFTVKLRTTKIKRNEAGELTSETKLQDVEAQDALNKKAAENLESQEVDNMDLVGDEAVEDINDRIYDRAYVYENPKDKLAVDVRAVLSTMPNYQIEDGQVKLDENNKPLFELNEFGEPTIVADFETVYAKLRDKLASVPMEQIPAKIKEMARIHKEFAAIDYELEKRRVSNSDFYAKFMAHFNSDKKDFITVIHDSNDNFRVTRTNQADLESQIASEWQKQSSYLEVSENPEREGDVDLDKAKQAYDSILAAREVKDKHEETWTPRKKEKMSTKDLVDLERTVAYEMIEAAQPAMDVLGIKIAPEVWKDVETKNDPGGIKFYNTVVETLLLTDAVNPASLELMAISLTENKDPYTEEKNNSLPLLVNLVKDYETDSFTATFMNGEKKTVYAINLHNHLSKTMLEIKTNPQEFATKMFQDVFYNPNDDQLANKFLQIIQDPKILEKIEVANFDTYKAGGDNVTGIPYDRTSTQESILSRALAFNNSDGTFGWVNTGTKSDKGQSIYIKLPKLDPNQVQGIIKATIAQERMRIDRVKNFSKFLPDNANYKKNGKEFLYLPALNDIPGAEQDPDDVNNTLLSNKERVALKEQIEGPDGVIDQFIDQVVGENFMMLAEEGLITLGPNNEIKDTQFPEQFFDGKDKAEVLREFILNDFIWNMELGKVFMGDLAMYSSKSPDLRTTDYFKRAYQTITPGADLFVSQETGAKGTTKTHLNVLTMKDPLVINSKEYLDALTRGMNPEAKAEMVKAYGKFDSATDAMSYVTVNAWKELHLGFGTWTNAHEEFYINAWSVGINPVDAINSLTTWKTAGNKQVPLTSEKKQSLKKKLSKTYLEAIKPFYYGSRNITLDEEVGGDLVWFEQYKMAMVPLFEEYADTRPPVRKLLDSLSEVNGDAVVFDTAIKVGQYNSVDAYSDSKDWTDGALGNMKQLPLSNYRVPQKISTKEETQTNAGTQMHKIVMGNLKLEEAIYDYLGEPITGATLLQEYDDAWAQKVAISERQLKKELQLGSNPDGDWSLPFTDKKQITDFLISFRDVLNSQNIDRQLHENYDKNIEIVQDDIDAYKFAVPVDFPAFSRKYESILMSLFRNGILRQKFPGASMVQMADYDTQTNNRLQFVNRTGDGVFSAEVAVPQWFLREILNIKEPIPVGKVSPANAAKYQKQLELLGYRIPTQGKNSMLPIHIAEILPEAQGSTVMVPAEITVQMGSDFDIDKLYLMSRSVDKKGNVVKYSNKVGLDRILAENTGDLNKIFKDLGLDINEYPITETEEDGTLCKDIKAKDGLIVSEFTKGSKWEIVKDLKGYPSHANGGVDLKIGKGGVSFTNTKGKPVKAKEGLVLQGVKETPEVKTSSPQSTKQHVDQVKKPPLKLTFATNKEIVNTKDPVATKIAQDKIKDRFEALEQIANKIWA